MKKDPKKQMYRKLILNRNTVRKLGDRQAQQVGGGRLTIVGCDCQGTTGPASIIPRATCRCG